MASFGLITLQVAADKAEPGTYSWVSKAPKTSKESTTDTGTVIIDKAKDAGLADDYTSQSGTLTIKSVAKNDNGAVTGSRARLTASSAAMRATAVRSVATSGLRPRTDKRTRRWVWRARRTSALPRWASRLPVA